LETAVNILMFLEEHFSAHVKSIVFFSFYMIACLQMHGEVKYFNTVRCRIHFWLI